MREAFDRLVMDIKSAANLNSPEATGFYAVYCPVCGKKSKKTGGFKFEDDKIIYNCFRGKCDASSVYTLGEYASRKFKRLLDTIGLRMPVELAVKRNSLQEKIKRELDATLYEKHSFKAIDPPDGKLVDLLEYGDDEWIEYFEDRAIPLDNIQRFTSGKYAGNCFIPFRLNNKLIGGQVITPRAYIAHNGGNEHVIYHPDDSLYKTETVFVVEGTLDAKCFPNTVAVLGDKISKEQAYFLRSKRVIMIPDRTGGNKFVEQFHRYGWEMCVPPWEEKDLNEAVIRYGVLVVYDMIMENTFTDKLQALSRFKLWEK